MSDQITDIENTVHEYRKTLERFADRTGAQTHHIERRGSGEEREKIARIDADLDAVERDAQLAAMQKRLKALEAQPMFEARRPQIAADLGSAEYTKRWCNALLRGDAAEFRALSLSSSNAGIPTDMERRIVERLQQASVMRQLAKVSSIDSKRTITVENALPTTALISEGASISASDPSFSTAISVVPYKFATRVTMSQEFIEDAIGQNGIGTGLQYVADKCAMSIALSQENYLTTGTNSSQPQGIAGAAMTNNTDLGAGGAGNAFADDITGDILIDLVHKINPQYRTGPKFSWVMHDSCIGAIRKLKTGTSMTDYIWKPSDVGGLSEGVPGTIYGIPYRTNAYMTTATTTTNGSVVAVVGNFDYFEMFERTGVTSMIDPYSAAATHQTNLILYTRWDSKIMLNEAFASITV
jgi:HK97 family phage major capsid protein